MSVSAAEIPDKSFLQTVGDRRSIRYYDPDKKVEDWKIQTILQTARFASCQGNINATEAIVVQKESCDIWDEIEECVSGFNVQMINQASHIIFWLTNLNAWYGRANDGLSSLALSGALTKYHGWNYEFTMTQTVPRLMSFPTERTEILLRFETGQAVGNATLACTALGVGSCLLAFGRKPGGVEKAFGLTPNLKFTWAHAIGYPLEDEKAGGQRPRLKFDRLFYKDKYGVPLAADAGADEALKGKGLIQEQAPLPGRIDEIDKLASQFSRDPGVVSWPEKEVRRLINDDDWDFGPNIKKRAEEVLAGGGLPDYPEEMRETFQKLMEEHNIDASKYLS
jgi:nitroreductase